jgi:hypothetical protein
MPVITTFLIWVGTEAALAAGKAVAGAAVSKLVDIPIDAALGIEVQGVTIAAWGERGKMIALAAFTMGKVVPDESFETKVKERFKELQKQVDVLRRDLDELKNEMTAFKWHVLDKFDKADEEKLWKSMLTLDNTLDSFYEQLSSLGKSTAPLEKRRQRALDLANSIVTTLRPQVKNTRDSFHGAVVEDVFVRGFLEIWQVMALRDADHGWNGERLARIYGLLESKFTRALLIQVKCARLLMEAYEALHGDDPSEQSGVDYFVDDFYPILKKEVEGFRNIIESLAINLIPLPTGQMLPLGIPDEIAGMLARLDMFTAQALMGKVSNSQTIAAPGRQLPGVPALAGCWGRVVVPASRWIRRAKGSKEEARVTLTAQGGRTVTCRGTLELRAIRYLPYENENKVKLHKGYQIQVGNEPRDMDEMLMAHFTPGDVLPPDLLAGTLDAQLEDQNGDVLARTQVFVVPIPLDATAKATAPYGTFMMGFTGGAGVRGR